MRLAVTGPPGCGKTTLCARVAEAMRSRGIPLGGFVTEEVRGPGGRRTGFDLRDLATGRRARLASDGEGPGPRVGRYRVHLEGASVGARALRDGLARNAGWLVVDEVAPMELASPDLAAALGAALDSPASILASLHLRTSHPIARRIRQEFEVHPLVPAEREPVARLLLDKVFPPPRPPGR